MHQGLAPRLAAAAILADVAGAGHVLDEFFGDERPHKRLANLDARDRGLVRSIATVAVRRLGTIRKALAQLMARGLPKRPGDLEWHLTVGAAQVLFLDVPDHAAVDLAVRAVQSDSQSLHFAKLANGVLRNLLRQREAILAASDPLDDDTPPWLAQRWRKVFGEETARSIAAAHRNEPTLDLTVRQDPEDWAKRLDGIVLPTGSVRLRTHTPVRQLEGYDAGGWWVQDAASALPARLVRAKAGERIIDLCAAPGGKTATLAAAGADVVALDRSAERLRRLDANLERLGLKVRTEVADALDYEADGFDATLLDAPCTTTGTIRRHPDVAWVKRTADIAVMGDLQRRLLDKAADMTKPGGRLIYGVCSLEPEEGEDQIEAFLERRPGWHRKPIEAAELGGLTECLTARGELRTLPFHLAHAEPRLSGLDGFFAARLVHDG